MIDRKDSCLLEAKKKGLCLWYNPPGALNRCYYSCLSKVLKLNEDDLINKLEKFMIENQVIPVENVGVQYIKHTTFYFAFFTATVCMFSIPMFKKVFPVAF